MKEEGVMGEDWLREGVGGEVVAGGGREERGKV
jgi:hypothetical protein